jgi:TetR/AcrR family transcriptional regulator, regulator of biofilm formation and stress response
VTAPATLVERTPDQPPTGARERILRATLELIAHGGVAAVTNRRVAVVAGISLGSLTYHFQTQAQLLHESMLLYVTEETERRERLAAQLRRQRLTLEQAAQAVEQVIAASTDVPEQLAELELHLHAARDPELREASRRSFVAHEQIASAALTALGLPDADRHAYKVVALMSGLAVRRLAGGGHDARGTAQALVTLVRGLGEEAGRSKSARIPAGSGKPQRTR